MSGHDTYDYLIDCALGQVHQIEFKLSEQVKSRVAVLKFFHTPYGGGKVKKIYGIDYLESEKNIKEYALNFSEGDVIKDCVSDSARIGYYIACSDTVNELNTVMKNVQKKFYIEVE